MTVGDGRHRLVDREGVQRAGILLFPKLCGPSEELRAVVTGRTLRRRVDQLGAGLCRDVQVLGIDAALEMVSPGQERVDPRRDRVPVTADRVDDERAAPAIVPERGHRRLMPFGLVLAAIAERTRDEVVAVGIAVGLDLDPIADDALDGEAPRVDRRSDILDDGADPAIAG